MARIRSIHPEACTSERLARVGAEAERCYWRLQTHCDDDGRAEDNVRLIWAALFPLHETVGPADVDGWLDELEQAGLLQRYVVEERRYLAVTQWGRFQHPQRHKPSKFPEPPAICRVHVRDTASRDLVLVAPGEGEGVGDGEGGEIAPRAARARDPIWDALIEAWDLDGRELTETERGRVNKAAKELRDINADPAEILARKQMFQLQWPDITATMLSVAGRWAECRPDPARLQGRAPRAASSIARAVAKGSP